MVLPLDCCGCPSDPTSGKALPEPWRHPTAEAVDPPHSPHPDERVTALHNHLLDAGPYPCVWGDALTQKVRAGDRIVNVHALIAVGVNTDGHREILGLTPPSERTVLTGSRSCVR
ncbi:transposase [Streptomyces sp. NPDC003328]